jgi:DNA repair photolyase
VNRVAKQQQDKPIRGRGASWNPANRFDGRSRESDPDVEIAAADLELGRPVTEYIEDETRSILSRNNSPDLAFACSVNPYRGCEHGCIYCYARPMHEYAGYSAGLDFETRIFVKRRAPELLRAALASRSWVPQAIALCGATDPYQPVERSLGLTRGCLEVLAEFRNPVVVITKNRLVTRDVDLLAELARFEAVDVCI